MTSVVRLGLFAEIAACFRRTHASDTRLQPKLIERGFAGRFGRAIALLGLRKL